MLTYRSVFRYYFFATQEAINDSAYHMDDEEAEEIRRAAYDSPEHPVSSPPPPPPSPSPEPEEFAEYLQPVDSEGEVLHIPDEPSESETESELEDLVAQLSDGDWTEVAATTASANVSANVDKGSVVSLSAVSKFSAAIVIVCGLLKDVLGSRTTTGLSSSSRSSGTTSEMD